MLFKAVADVALANPGLYIQKTSGSKRSRQRLIWPESAALFLQRSFCSALAESLETTRHHEQQWESSRQINGTSYCYIIKRNTCVLAVLPAS